MKNAITIKVDLSDVKALIEPLSDAMINAMAHVDAIASCAHCATHAEATRRCFGEAVTVMEERAAVNERAAEDALRAAEGKA